MWILHVCWPWLRWTPHAQFNNDSFKLRMGCPAQPRPANMQEVWPQLGRRARKQEERAEALPALPALEARGAALSAVQTTKSVGNVHIMVPRRAPGCKICMLRNDAGRRLLALALALLLLLVLVSFPCLSLALLEVGCRKARRLGGGAHVCVTCFRESLENQICGCGTWHEKVSPNMIVQSQDLQGMTVHCMGLYSKINRSRRKVFAPFC